MQILAMLLSDATTFHKFCGMVGSAGVVAAAPLIGSLPPWAADVRDWVSFGAIVGGCFGTLMYGISLLLDIQKKWHDARQRQREELQEIMLKKEEVLCHTRRAELRCPELRKLLDAQAQEDHSEHRKGD